ncbi:MAG TPA: hypothetical protein VII33_07650, partial [Nakamurella sp.]
MVVAPRQNATRATAVMRRECSEHPCVPVAAPMPGFGRVGPRRGGAPHEWDLTRLTAARNRRELDRRD